MFAHLGSGDPEAFFKHVDEHVKWTVMGTHVLAGEYHDLTKFQQDTFGRLAKIMKPPGVQLAVRNIIGGDHQEWATVELVINAVAKNGELVSD